MFYQGDRILPEALVIHNRFNTPFTLNFSAQRHYFFIRLHSLTFFAVAPFKMLTAAEKSLSYFFNPCHIDFFINISFIFKLATQVTFNMVAQSCNIMDISR
ncbi:Uncharacterised protein [Escherichia coli]|uniref:Uncharacterized protein n=1 Tax=Escherichia coli TaxID=562 RepID=A0A377AWB8_ECOLX|nr:Uncharacterised protein [Escherichia coli]